jgi:uncharacterized protein (DUF305 family)
LTARIAATETSIVHSAPRQLLICAITALLSTAACAGTDPGTTPVNSAATALSGAPGFFGTDLAWVEINIAMDEQLLPLLDLAPANGAKPAVKVLAAQVKTVHSAELAALRRLHDQAGLPAQNPHEGMEMPGMVTPDILAQAARTRGTDFNTLLLLYLKAHLEQGVNLATSETKAGVEPQTLALAKQVLVTRAELLPRVEHSASGNPTRAELLPRPITRQAVNP